jgi:hypothetical protein
MKAHAYRSDGRSDFDSNCAVCGGKCRDSIHGATDEIRAANAENADRMKYHEKGNWLVQVNRLGFWHGYFAGMLQDSFPGEAAALAWLDSK